MLHMLLTDSKDSVLNHWRESLNESFACSYDLATPMELMKLHTIDAVLMRSIFAAEKFNANIIPGESQVISSQGTNNMPNWVVTTPSYPQNNTPSPSEYDYCEWKAIFLAINLFNSTSAQNNIKVLGVHISWLYSFRNGKPLKEVLAMKQAYIDCYLKWQ